MCIMSDVIVREARSQDAEVIVDMIRELASFERLYHEARATVDDILRDGFSPECRFECLIAERAGEGVGFALFFHNYSTFEGRAGLYVEDIFVKEGHRGHGVGRMLLERLAAVAEKRSCPRLELSVLHWNPARSFYERLGFVEMKDWRPYRLSGESLLRFAQNGRSHK